MRAFDAVVARALAKRPEDRFATAEEMRDALRAAAARQAAGLAVWPRWSTRWCGRRGRDAGLAAERPVGCSRDSTANWRSLFEERRAGLRVEEAAPSTGW